MISVIVPVYLVEKYLNRCIDSILAQTYEDFELILVDDGSPDNCGKICDGYAKKDSRIIVIHKENGGLSDARNAGLDWMFENSKSEWVSFVDSDDWVHPQYLEVLFSKAVETKNELIVCDYENFREDDIVSPSPVKDVAVTESAPEDFFCESSFIETVTWAKLYHRDCFNSIRFPFGKIHEDNFVTYRIIFSQQSVLHVEIPLYYHLNNPEGISNSRCIPKHMPVFEAYRQQIDFFEENGYSKAKEKIVVHSADIMCKHIRIAKSTDKYQNYAKIIRQMLRSHINTYRNYESVRRNQKFYSYAYPKRYLFINQINKFKHIIKRIITKLFGKSGYTNRLLKHFIFPKSERIGLPGKIYFYHSIMKNLKQFKHSPDIDDFPVDFVVSWVDGNDPEWIKEKRKYELVLDDDKKIANPDARYRDWEMFHYWFRAVEKYAPWVRNVFLLTCGHVPEWLDTSHPKLKIIRHSEFIPAEYLPTFSSHTIELNMWRIEELSEHFVYFNDDMLLTAPVKKSVFFTKGLPKYCPLTRPKYTFNDMTVFEYVLMNKTGLFNSDIDFREVIKQHPEKWIYPFKSAISKYNMRTFKDGYLSGMRFTHVCTPYRKSSMSECAKKYSEKIHKTSRNKFRTYLDVNHQIFQIWEMVNAEFVPVEDFYLGRLVNVRRERMDLLRDCVLKEQNKCVCINDNDALTEEDFNLLKPRVIAMLEEKFPERSGFECS